MTICRPFYRLGSPPLTRGILTGWEVDTSTWRFTPAHAGNTPEPSGTAPRIEVHPRSRGEYVLNVLVHIPFQGSPPLTRGIPAETYKKGGLFRFTPAHAGNTFSRCPVSRYIRVHPRSRGEYRGPGRMELPPQGSPPLTRGILFLFPVPQH